jgi:hypothetical protein
MSESKGEGGSWLYGIILMVSGGLVFTVGLLNILGITDLAYYVQSIMPELAAYMNTLTYIEMTIGAWGFIGGVGLIKDQEWGWGISLVVLSLVIVTFVSDVIAGITAGTWTDLYFWAELVALIIAAVGIVYLLMTKEKYA